MNGMSRLLLRTDTWLLRVDLALAFVAGVIIFIMMMITAADVVMRYAFNSPLRWAYDLIINYLLVASFFLGLSYTLRLNHHICVDFFARKLPEGFYHLVSGAGCLLAAVAFAVIAWFGANDAWQAWATDEVIIGALIWPVWATKIAIPLGMAPLALRSAHRGLAHLAARKSESAQVALGIDLAQVAAAEV